jgi:hypothetical protein
MSGTYISASLRRFVFDRAQGCCEYCLIPEALALASHHLDHVIAEKHGGETIAENLALSCLLCNQAKGSDIASIDPESGETEKLYHPRKEQWRTHFRIEVGTGEIVPLTAVGRATVRLLKMNRSEELPERQILAELGMLSINLE